MAKRTKTDFEPVVDRPWGYYYVIGSGLRWVTKVLVIEPGLSTSMQRHLHRSESYVVVEGVANINMNGDVKTLYEQHMGRVSPGVWHQIANPGKIDLVVVETWTGSYLAEDDIERKD